MLTSMEFGKDSDAPLPTANIYLLDPKQVEHYWKDILESLDAAPDLWDKWFTRDSITERILSNFIQVWVVCEPAGPIRALFLTQVLCADIGDVLQVFWMRGALPAGAVKCISLALDRFGAHRGCVRLSVVGRKGWERVLKDFGAEVESIALSRPIEKMTRN